MNTLWTVVAPWYRLCADLFVTYVLVTWLCRRWPRRAPAPKPAPVPARPGVYSVQKCPCGSGYWIIRSNGPNEHFTGPVPTGEHLARVLREGR